MIPYNPKNWFTLIFNFHSSKLMKEMLPNLFGIGMLSAAMVWFFTDIVPLTISPGVNIHTFVGIVLGLVLVFRTNTAYDRWWEGRKLLGGIVNRTRQDPNVRLPLWDPLFEVERTLETYAKGAGKSAAPYGECIARSIPPG